MIKYKGFFSKFFIVFITFLLFICFCSKNPVKTMDIEDEERILFIRGSKEFREICSIRPDGTNLKVLVHYNKSIKRYYSWPKWSPDKSKIVVQEIYDYVDTYSSLWIMDNEGTLLSKLTDKGSLPIWHPNGLRVIFTNDDFFSEEKGIFSLNIFGSNKITLFESQQTILATDISSNGNMLLITDYSDEGEIGILDLNSKEIEYFTENQSHDFLARWSNENNEIIYLGEVGKKSPSELLYDIFYIDRIPKLQANLTNNPDVYSNPLFSPDGSKIAFSKNVKLRSSDIFVMDLISKEITNLTNTTCDSIWNTIYDWK